MEQVALESFVKNIKNIEEASVICNGEELFIYTKDKNQLVKMMEKKQIDQKDEKCTEK